MSSGELSKSGVGAHLPPGGELILSPIEAAHNNLVSRGLVAAATGQGPWEAWPDSMRVSPVPGPARLGLVHVEDGDRGYPFLVPLLGDGHVVIGNPSLNVPVKPQYQKVEILKIAAEERRAKEEAATANRDRRQMSLAQRSRAIGITSALIARSAGTLPEGDLRVTVYDPIEGGRHFAPLAIMNRSNRADDSPALYEYTGNLSILLDRLSNDVQQRYELLGSAGFSSLRAQAERLGQLAVPWRIVALVSGLDEQLRPSDQAALNLLVRQAADVGVSIIMSGFGTASPATRLGLEPDGRAVSSTLPDRKIHLDAPPTFADLQRSVTHRRPVNAGTRVSGHRYNQAIAARWQKYEQSKTAMADHFRDFPLLTPDFLTNQVELGDREFDLFAITAAHSMNGEDVALNTARWALLESEQPIATRLAAWTALRLTQSAADNPRSHWRDPALYAAAGKYVQTRIADLAQLVFATAPGGLEYMQVHPNVLPYIAQYLPDEPPAWAYQLVADTATVSRFSLTPGREVALEAICYDLEQTFNPDQEQSLNLQRRENRALRDVLIELRLLGLHDFAEEGVPEEMCDVLARRAADRLANVTREQLPKAAHQLFDAYQDYVAARDAHAISSTPYEKTAGI